MPPWSMPIGAPTNPWWVGKRGFEDLFEVVFHANILLLHKKKTVAPLESNRLIP